MDFTELQLHADRHGKWTMQLSANDQLTCFTSDLPTAPRYRYYHNGVGVTAEQAEALVDAAFTAAFNQEQVA